MEISGEGLSLYLYGWGTRCSKPLLGRSRGELGCCTVGAFFDNEIDRILGIEGREAISVYWGAIGRIGQDL